ncbi:hypothetical protein QR680_013531 [Steinernema hermaphroditum]|uniref:Uncharacterized protein n=1 Tax=Steinernema hermaphroditum TaxID=289476 RepID=A0AA39I8F7_9BILA|nr:hypothetical protein QR680_013531 [Steinernema hermaphroditum]
MSGEGVYTSSESEDDEPTLQQQVYVPIVEEPPEMIVFGETAKKFREYAEQAGLLRRTPVTINVVNFPRGRVVHGVWKKDSASTQQAPGISSMMGGHHPRGWHTGDQSGNRINGHLLSGRGTHTRGRRGWPSHKARAGATVAKADIEGRHAVGVFNEAAADRLVGRLSCSGGSILNRETIDSHLLERLSISGAPRREANEDLAESLSGLANERVPARGAHRGRRGALARMRTTRSHACHQRRRMPFAPKGDPPTGPRNTLTLDVLPLANAFMHFDQGDIGVCLERFNAKTLEFEWEAEPMHAITNATLCLKNLYIYGTESLKKEKLYEECEMKTALDLLKLPAFNRLGEWDIARKLTIRDVSRFESRGAGKFIDTINECFEEVDFSRVRGFKYNIELVLQRCCDAQIARSIVIQKCDITFPTLKLISDIFKQKQCEEDVFDSIQSDAMQGPSKKFTMSYPSSEQAVIEAILYVARRFPGIMSEKRRIVFRANPYAQMEEMLLSSESSAESDASFEYQGPQRSTLVDPFEAVTVDAVQPLGPEFTNVVLKSRLLQPEVKRCGTPCTEQPIGRTQISPEKSAVMNSPGQESGVAEVQPASLGVDAGDVKLGLQNLNIADGKVASAVQEPEKKVGQLRSFFDGLGGSKTTNGTAVNNGSTRVNGGAQKTAECWEDLIGPVATNEIHLPTGWAVPQEILDKMGPTTNGAVPVAIPVDVPVTVPVANVAYVASPVLVQPVDAYVFGGYVYGQETVCANSKEYMYQDETGYYNEADAVYMAACQPCQYQQAFYPQYGGDEAVNQYTGYDQEHACEPRGNGLTPSEYVPGAAGNAGQAVSQNSTVHTSTIVYETHLDPMGNVLAVNVSTLCDPPMSYNGEYQAY